MSGGSSDVFTNTPAFTDSANSTISDLGMSGGSSDISTVTPAETSTMGNDNDTPDEPFVYDNEDTCIIQEYFEVKQNSPQYVRGDMVFFQVASNLLGKGFTKSMSDVKARYNSLQQSFKAKFDRFRLTGESGIGVNDPMYNLFLSHLGEEDPSLNPPATVSLGHRSINQFHGQSTSQGKKRGQSDNGRRRRRVSKLMGSGSPSVSSHSAPLVSALHQPSLPVSIQEQRLAVEANFVSYFGLYQREVQKRSETLQASVDLLREIRNERSTQDANNNNNNDM